MLIYYITVAPVKKIQIKRVREREKKKATRDSVITSNIFHCVISGYFLVVRVNFPTMC